MKKYAIIVFVLFTVFVFGQHKSALKITKLTGDFYVYETYKFYKNKPISANGMYLVTNEGVVMFDSPWDTTQALPLLDSIRKKHNKEVVMCIATHSHDDRTGSLGIYNQKGIKTFSTKQTDEICKINVEERASNLFEKDTVFKLGQYSFKTFYPGKGHTPDNIVIWFENEQILYGGCFVKSSQAKDLGNLSDANVLEWEKSINKVIQLFPKPKYIITGHQRWKSKKSLKHTLKLIENDIKESIQQIVSHT